MCGFPSSPFLLDAADPPKPPAPAPAPAPVQEPALPPCQTNNDRIASLLTELGIEFIREHSFPGLTGIAGGPLRYDFFLPTPGLLIEYQGAQHYPCGFGTFPGPGNVFPDALEETEFIQGFSDDRKVWWARMHHIPFIQIPPGLSLQIERQILHESVTFWTAQQERYRMAAEDTWYLRLPTNKYRLAQEKLDDPHSRERARLDHLKECRDNLFSENPQDAWPKLAKRQREVLFRRKPQTPRERKVTPTKKKASVIYLGDYSSGLSESDTDDK